MVFPPQGHFDSQSAAIESIAPKIGCGPDTLRAWVQRAETDSGRRDGVTTAERDRIKALKWVDWFNNRRLLEPVGYITPTEAEEAFYAKLRWRSSNTSTASTIHAAATQHSTAKARSPLNGKWLKRALGAAQIRESSNGLPPLGGHHHSRRSKTSARQTACLPLRVQKRCCWDDDTGLLYCSDLSMAPASFCTSSSIWSSLIIKGGASSTWSPDWPSMVPLIG